MINHATLYILTTVKKFEYGECKTKFYIFAVICLEYLSAVTDLSSQYVDCYSNLLSSKDSNVSVKSLTLPQCLLSIVCYLCRLNN